MATKTQQKTAWLSPEEKIAQRLTQWDVEVAKSYGRKLSRLLPNNTRDWWEQALTTHRTELLGKLQEILSVTTETRDGCLEVPIKTPKRVTWKGKRLYAYQLLCVASQGVLPRQDEVVRHRCHNRRCINPEHLQLGTQQDNIHDERTRQYR
jgi:hypothetical protein